MTSGYVLSTPSNVLSHESDGWFFIQASGKEKLEKTRQDAERAKDDVRARITETREDVRSTASEYGHDAQRKFDEYKSSVSNALVDAHDNTEKKLEEAKAAGSGWFSWGPNKAEDAGKDGAEKVTSV